MPALVAYHGKPSIKKKYVDRVRTHAQADRLIKGVGWEDGKGCAVGCTLEAYDHARYPIELGIPQTIARLEDVIFENLPNEEAQKWPLQFLQAIRPGADLERAQWRILNRILIEAVRHVPAVEPWGVRAAIDAVSDLLQKAALTGAIDASAARIRIRDSMLAELEAA